MHRHRPGDKRKGRTCWSTNGGYVCESHDVQTRNDLEIPEVADPNQSQENVVATLHTPMVVQQPHESVGIIHAGGSRSFGGVDQLVKTKIDSPSLGSGEILEV